MNKCKFMQAYKCNLQNTAFEHTTNYDINHAASKQIVNQPSSKLSNTLVFNTQLTHLINYFLHTRKLHTYIA